MRRCGHRRLRRRPDVAAQVLSSWRCVRGSGSGGAGGKPIRSNGVGLL